MEKIKEANLEKYIGEKIEVESKYNIKNILGYGATSVVYRASLQNVSTVYQSNDDGSDPY